MLWNEESEREEILEKVREVKVTPPSLCSVYISDGCASEPSREK